jgi:hypothetical protein
MGQWFTPALIGLAVVAAAPAARAQDPLPSAVVPALTAAFGGYDAARHCWRVTGRDGNGAVRSCMAIVRADRVRAPDGPRLYLLLGGSSGHDCLACEGLVAFAVFDASLLPRMLARGGPTPDGAFGQPTAPQHMPLVRLGFTAWGWIEESGYTDQGETESKYTVWLPRGERVVTAGVLTGSHSNEGSVCGPPLATDPPGTIAVPCFEINVTYSVAETPRGAPHYPILLHVSGTEGKRQVQSTITAPFDANAFAYRQSAGLP